MRHRFLTVPYNEQGITEYNSGVEESENLYTVELPENEFAALINPFGAMNSECDLLIDDYESEEITADKLMKCRQIIANLKDNIPVFFKAIEMAIEKNTMIALDF